MSRTQARALAVPLMVAAIVVPLVTAGPAHAGTPFRPTRANADGYAVKAGRTLTVGGHGVLANDFGDLTTVVRSSATAHGTVRVNADGSFSYTPAAGYTGPDSFTYTTSDAVDLYKTHLPPLATVGGVQITGGAFGSAFTQVPGSRTLFYGLTDRGPNVDGPNGTKVEPIPDFAPAIGLFALVDGRSVLLKKITLKAADGTPYNGQVNCSASTGETITDLNGTVLPCTATGYDPEGIVALKDGTFWVSDEYGPLITHFDRNGRQLGRLSPFDGSLPQELSKRLANRGMEGLTITPDGKTLVGLMQSALNQTGSGAIKPANVVPLRLVTVDLRTGALHEYLYPLSDPKVNSGAASEITAVSATTFLVVERDGKLEPGAYKRIYTVDISGATDVGPAAAVPGAVYDGANGGLLVGGRTLEQLVGDTDTATATATLAGAGITLGTKTLTLDVAGLVSTLNPDGAFFGHDKVEGVAALNGGTKLVISNDNDFGLGGLDTKTNPWTLQPKILPDGTQDDGEVLSVDLTRVSGASTATTYTATVNLKVIK
ncbi:esterase-like activity of phytase family protein [Spongisporangium articulatum]|uniref:Esterase-like activity of phytase family protein n=1 Tax=Spongisporangium articulatum TaxID=3362603 RepID=A0ABW8AQJ7_9ACTN